MGGRRRHSLAHIASGMRTVTPAKGSIDAALFGSRPPRLAPRPRRRRSGGGPRTGGRRRPARRRSQQADSVHRRGAPGRRAGHLDHLQCRQRPVARDACAEVMRAFFAGRRADDRFLADVRLVAGRDRPRPRASSAAGRRSSRRTRCGSARPRAARADRAVAPAVGRAALRPGAGPQPARLAASIWRRCSP